LDRGEVAAARGDDIGRRARRRGGEGDQGEDEGRDRHPDPARALHAPATRRARRRCRSSPARSRRPRRLSA
jgi:hypothetical protein